MEEGKKGRKGSVNVAITAVQCLNHSFRHYTDRHAYPVAVALNKSRETDPLVPCIPGLLRFLWSGGVLSLRTCVLAAAQFTFCLLILLVSFI